MDHGKQDIQPKRYLFKTLWKHQRLKSQQEVQTLRREGSQDKGESICNTAYRREMEKERAYSESLRLTRSRSTQISSGFTQLGIQKISGQESPLLTIPGIFREKTSTKGKNKTNFSQSKNKADPMIQEFFHLVK
ncbi:hypothetical protein O181_028960 [Austropuccinia psidii MF-1]|uniref:Uncharacterized protein n=1 Tax=Austropuccinia psidii MF-1 TaxID=1389203 RepID=A0A9Q3CUD5_9BASI|nr:hypothetical protein [Austropuccinia psidii MF-1]